MGRGPAFARWPSPWMDALDVLWTHSVYVLAGWARQPVLVGARIGIPSSIPGQVLAQSVRALAGWARWLVPYLGSPVQSQAGSWLSWLEPDWLG